MNKVIDKGFRSCRFVSTIVKDPVFAAVEAILGAIVTSHIYRNVMSQPKHREIT